jgi:pSer/pThr/pTyr-binding forkhead associated (FHA) protein
MPKLQIFLMDAGEVTRDLTDETVTIGRLPDNTIQIDDVSVSSHHLQLTLSGGDYHLKDLNSTNGTRLNGKNVTEGQLHAGDRVRIGKIETVYLSDIQTPLEKRELPTAEVTPVSVAESSVRPANFSNASPFRIKKKKADPASRGIYVLTLLAIAAIIGAGAFIYMMQLQVQP